jgi:hypothetical protein
MPVRAFKPLRSAGIAGVAPAFTDYLLAQFPKLLFLLGSGAFLTFQCSAASYIYILWGIYMP